jgi:hypothetical protein
MGVAETTPNPEPPPNGPWAATHFFLPVFHFFFLIFYNGILGINVYKK